MARRSMFAALTVAFIIVTIVPGAIATVAGVLAFQDSTDSQARSTIAQYLTMATQMASDRALRTVSVLEAQGGYTAFADALAGVKASGAPAALGTLAGTAHITYALLVDRDGTVIAASRGSAGATYGADPIVRAALDGRVGGAFELLPQAEIDRRGLAETIALPAKSVSGGTSHRESVRDAIALVSAAPVLDTSGKTRGALVGVEILNNSSGFVDEVTQRVGTAATVFQDEIRISTSVRLDTGARATGTAASDAVQKAVLQGGKQYTGQATVVGKPYVTSYSPMRDPSGRIIGMLFVGTPTAPYEAATRLFALRFLIAAAVGLALAAGAGTFVARRLTDPLTAVNAAAEAVAARDLTRTAPVGGTRETAQLATAFNTMVGALSAVMVSASDTSSRLRTIAGELSAQSEGQTESASRQAAAVAQTTATLEELASTYASIAAGAEEVMRLAEDAVEAAQDGQSTIEQSIGGLEQLFTGAEAIETAAEGVTDAVNEITGAISIIESIAEQTKILALNAAIEAARAGEAGKGFGVVATEIRGLADSVTESTRRIEQMVERIQSSTSGLGGLSRDENALAEQSVELGHKSQAAFSSILEQMVSTASAAREIAGAAAQQRVVSNQVVQAMQQVSTAQSESASGAQRVFEAARELQQHGTELDDNLKGFKL